MQVTSTSGLVKCPFCAEEIQPNAQKCRYCGEWLTPQNQNATAPLVPHSSVQQQNAALKGQSYINQSSTASEVTLYCAKLHWIIFVGPAILSAIFFFMAVAAFANQSSGIGLGLVFISVVIVGSAVLRFLTAEFAVTTNRIICKDGFVSRKSNELMMNKIEGLSVEQSLLGRVLNYGTLVVGGTGGSKERFPDISEPLELRKQLQSQLRL